MPKRNTDIDLTIDELIRSQLDGKTRALARYDGILWKIRSGYVIVLYGALTIFSGNGFHSNPTEIPRQIVLPPKFLLIAIGISISAFLIDVHFVISKLRVIQARDKLSDIALNLATTERNDLSQSKEELADLLHLSGESLTWPKFPLVWNATVSPIPLLYVIGPLIVFFVQKA